MDPPCEDAQGGGGQREDPERQSVGSRTSRAATAVGLLARTAALRSGAAGRPRSTGLIFRGGGQLGADGLDASGIGVGIRVAGPALQVDLHLHELGGAGEVALLLVDEP
jgi:hypothetical protein